MNEIIIIKNLNNRICKNELNISNPENVSKNKNNGENKNAPKHTIKKKKKNILSMLSFGKFLKIFSIFYTILTNLKMISNTESILS